MTSDYHTRFAMILMIVASMLLPTLATARTWHVPVDAPTIQAGIDSASVGDDVLVAPGTYFEHDITMKAGITVHSDQGPGVTTVDAGGAGVGFICTDLQEEVTIEGFTILNGRAQTEQHDGSGGGVTCIESYLLVRDCVVTGCSAELDGGGIYAGQSTIEIDACRVTGCVSGYVGGGIATYVSTTTITDCEIRDNETGHGGTGGGGGIAAWGPEVAITRCVVSENVARWGSSGGIGCWSSTFRIRDCIITLNLVYILGGTSGLGVGGSGVIEGCTVAYNWGAPPGAGVGVGYQSDVEIDRTIIAFNNGPALDCGYDSHVDVHCCDLYGNTQGDDLCGTDLCGNFSADPLFCDAENGDYTLDGCSPCLPGNHPDGVDCGLIGALAQGCGAEGMEETSWGRIKSLYRR